MTTHQCSYDCHAHFVPSHFPAYVGKVADVPWPSMRHSDCGHGEVMISGKVFRKVAQTAWDAPRREVDMDATGVDVQVVSPMPELLSYWLAPEDGATLCGFLNQELANLVARSPQRMLALGAVPLQDVELACRMLEDLMRDKAFRGVEIGTNVNGTPIGDPKFDEFFATAERVGASIFVHALRPVGDDRITGPLSLRAVLSFPCEVSFAIASAITGGLLSRRPGLRIAFSHGGGAFGSVLPRLRHAWQSTESTRSLVPEDPQAIARRLYYDTLVYNPETLRYLISQFGISQFVAGSDYPFQIAEPEPTRFVRGALTSEEAAQILHANAERFLGTGVPMQV